MSDISITITDSISVTDKGTAKLEIFVTALGMSSDVFAVEVLPGSADEYAPIARFSHVCSPMELQEFPAGCPGECCYFRISNMEAIFDTARQAEAVKAAITADIRELEAEMRAISDL